MYIKLSHPPHSSLSAPLFIFLSEYPSYIQVAHRLLHSARFQARMNSLSTGADENWGFRRMQLKGFGGERGLVMTG